MAARLHSWLAAQVRRGPAGLATGFVQSVLSTLAWLVQATEILYSLPVKAQSESSCSPPQNK